MQSLESIGFNGNLLNYIFDSMPISFVHEKFLPNIQVEWCIHAGMARFLRLARISYGFPCINNARGVKYSLDHSLSISFSKMEQQNSQYQRQT